MKISEQIALAAIFYFGQVLTYNLMYKYDTTLEK